MSYVIKTSCLTSILVLHEVIIYKKNIDHFYDLIDLLNICGAIDGTHIPLASFPHKRVTFVASDYLIRNFLIALWCKQFAM
jgi:hypothetical protein